MTQKELNDHIRDLLDERNYLGAGMHIADLEDDVARKDLLGEVAEKIIIELETLPWRQNKERVYYLRSILAWVMKEVPGLSHLYREQLKQASGHTTLAEILKRTANIPSNPEEAVDAVKETMEQIKNNLDDSADAFSGTDLKSTGDKLLKQAEKGILDGLDQVSSFLNSLGSNKDQTNKE